MSCTALTTATSVRLNVLEQSEEGDPKYELDFNVSVPANATRAVFMFEGNEYIVYFGCSESESGDLLFLEMPVGWNEDMLSCDQLITASIQFFSCTTDPCCNGGEVIDMPEDTSEVFNTDTEFIGGMSA